MSPPEIWGPPIWTMFHTLIEQLNENAYNEVIPSLFAMIVQICKYLPCPECSRDATVFLAKIKLSDYKTKTDFKNMLYLFHNYVNNKKRKPLYNYANMDKYANLNIINVVNNFVIHYNTKGNMKLLNESFHRRFVINNFITWFNGFKRAFIKPNILNSIVQVEEQNMHKNEEKTVNEHVEEPVKEETVIEEPFKEETVIEEPVNEVLVDEPIKMKRGRKNKAKK